eukprot:TRINITY_DN11450_c0_g2_i1.p1 TRINITY_DN11450_c0_g2~~TRINITY_DN11450_c0_g2_i1.p1  ORF type:complete len:199 (-),score=62.55 TRINITY_DN11450_c0_g2_i1:64-660(-)
MESLVDKEIHFETIQTQMGKFSKEMVRQFLDFAFKVRRDFAALDPSSAAAARAIIKDIPLKNSELEALIVETIKLVKVCLKLNFQEIDTLFAPGFNETVKKYICDNITSLSSDWENEMNIRMREGMKFVDVDWRVDVQVFSSDEGKTRKPMVYMRLDALDQASYKLDKTLVQMNKSEFDILYENLRRVKEQLDLLVSE